MNDGRQGQQPDVVQFETKRPARQLHLVRDLDQPPEGDAFQGDGMAPAERIQVNPVPMVGRDHGEACETAFSRLGLLNAR